MSWLSKALHKVLPIAAAATAVATGNPEFAVAAYQGVKAVDPKKKAAIVEPPVADLPAPGFATAYESLPEGDKQLITIGGAMVGTLVLAKVLFGSGGRR